MRADDLPAVFALSQAVHTDYPERIEVLSEKHALFPAGCFVLADQDDGVHGYCFSHPWTLRQIPALDRPLGVLPAAPDLYFLHDIALAETARGAGHAGRLLNKIAALCRGMRLPAIGLIAVAGTQAFWTRRGFVRTQDETLQAAVRASYSAASVHMVQARFAA